VKAANAIGNEIVTDFADGIKHSRQLAFAETADDTALTTNEPPCE
jgi:hypothetical protein